MIQRIQSIYLFLAGLTFFSTLFFRSAVASDVFAWLVPTVIGVNILVAILAVGAIFLYSNRNQQLKVVTLLQFLALIGIIAVFAGAYLSGGVEEIPENLKGVALLALPMLGYLFIRLAGRQIKKDIELIRSVDRLRP